MIETTTPVTIITNQGNPARLYVAPDARGLELEVIAIELDVDTLLVIHAMPTSLRK